MKARIYKPTRTAMQSGKANTHKWVLEFVPANRPFTDPLMGWNGSKDTTQQVRMQFDSEAQAVEYANANHIEFELKEPEFPVIKAKSYAANFAYNKVN